MRRINHTHPRRGIARTVVTLAVIVSALRDGVRLECAGRRDPVRHVRYSWLGRRLDGQLQPGCRHGSRTGHRGGSHPELGLERRRHIHVQPRLRRTERAVGRVPSAALPARRFRLDIHSVRQLAGRHRPRSQHRSYGCATVVAGPEHRRVVVGCNAVQQPAHRPQVWRSLRHLVVPLVVHAELFTRVRLRLESLRVLRRTRRNAL